MSMKFVEQKTEKPKYVNSAAVVSVIADGKVRICYQEKVNTYKNPPEVKKVTFSDGEQCKIFEFSQLPMQFSSEDEGVEAVLRVKSEGSTVLEFLPWNEAGLKGRFVQFSRTNGEDTDPIPFAKEKWNKDDPYEADILQFSPQFRIEGGMFDGKLVVQYDQFSKSGIWDKEPHNPYNYSTFIKDEDGNVALGFQPLPNGATKYKWSTQVYDLRYCGLLEGASIPMPEDGNPLKAIEQKLQQANKLVEIEVSKGYVVSLASAKKLGTFGARAVETPAPVVPETSADEM
jgi:hypothetical protein